MELVNVDNFARAETARMFDNTLALTGGVNQFFHYRLPPTVDQQPVIRMNLDTLYSGAIVDVSEGATLILPEADGRYMSAMFVDEQHYDNLVLSSPGEYQLEPETLGSDHVSISLRTFVDSGDPDDVARVTRLQDAVVLEAKSANPFMHSDYDTASLDATREALLRLAEGITDTNRMFGKRSEVDPVRHLLGTAFGWGGLPEEEAFYYLVTEPRPVGEYTITFRDVPVDGFWSLTVYNSDGYLEPNASNRFGYNGVTATPDADGSVTIHLSTDDEERPNHLQIMDGWNYAIRLYKPHRSVLDGTWMPPVPQQVG